MSAESTFRCPVCRAAQTIRDTCRRCQADLSLVLRAHRRWTHLKCLRDDALARGRSQLAAEVEAELRWLAPTR